MAGSVAMVPLMSDVIGVSWLRDGAPIISPNRSRHSGGGHDQLAGQLACGRRAAMSPRTQSGTQTESQLPGGMGENATLHDTGVTPLPGI